MEYFVNVSFQVFELFAGYFLYFSLFVRFKEAFQNSHKWLNQISVTCRDDLFAVDS